MESGNAIANVVVNENWDGLEQAPYFELGVGFYLVEGVHFWTVDTVNAAIVNVVNAAYAVRRFVHRRG